MYALVDCNNFYASCERVFNPALRGKPVVVLSNNDGCAIARSNEAKALGIPMGAPAFEYRKLFEEHNVHVFSSNYALYGDMSSRVMTILGEYTPDIEIYSIDEAFLKFDGFDKYYNLDEYGQAIHKRILRGTGIPVSIGFAPTKALAKLANRIAKKFPERCSNVYVMDTDDKRIKALRWLKVEDVWGIGRAHAARLNRIKVFTAYDFTQLPDDWVRKNMSVVGLRLKHDLEGRVTIGKEEVKAKQNIACTRSFEKMLTEYAPIKERIATYAGSVAEKLRHEKSHTNMICVFLQTNPFRKDLPMYNPSICWPTGFPTNSSLELIRMAQQALECIYKPGYHYKKAGVIVMSITPEASHQLNLFTGSNPKHRQAMEAIDKVNRSAGRKVIRFGGQSMGRVWKMKQEKLSPCYTTRLSDLLTIKL
jgi:DNA polymerase V